MYLLGFLGAYFLITRQPKARSLGLVGARLQDLIFYLAIGLIVGARLGYVLFYQFPDLADYIRHPIEIFAIWHGGMSFHGGLLGTLLAGFLFCRRRKLPFWATADCVIVTAPVGLGLGRIGNFINGELFGRPSSVPWAMVFPEGGPLPRHPSQLYEAGLEGLVLFLILWKLKDMDLKPGGPGLCVPGLLRRVPFFSGILQGAGPPAWAVSWDSCPWDRSSAFLMIMAALGLWLVLPGKGAGGKAGTK